MTEKLLAVTWEVKIAFGIIAWIPLFPSTIWVTRKWTAKLQRE